MAKTYTIQYRETIGGRLQDHGRFNARNGAGAIAQAAKIIASWGCECVEICATECETVACFLRMGSDYLSDAKPYASKAAAVDAYTTAANELARYGQTLEASLHLATSADDLQEYPDFVLSIGPRGGVRVEAA